MKRGSVVRINLEDTLPPEFGKTRPAVIISNSEQNRLLPTVVVVPLSARPPAVWPLRIEVPAGPAHRASYAVVPGLRQVSKERLVETIAELPYSFMDTLMEACMAYLDD